MSSYTSSSRTGSSSIGGSRTQEAIKNTAFEFIAILVGSEPILWYTWILIFVETVQHVSLFLSPTLPWETELFQTFADYLYYSRSLGSLNEWGLLGTHWVVLLASLFLAVTIYLPLFAMWRLQTGRSVQNWMYRVCSILLELLEHVVVIPVAGLYFSVIFDFAADPKYEFLDLAAFIASFIGVIVLVLSSSVVMYSYFHSRRGCTDLYRRIVPTEDVLLIQAQWILLLLESAIPNVAKVRGVMALIMGLILLKRHLKMLSFYEWFQNGLRASVVTLLFTSGLVVSIKAFFYEADVMDYVLMGLIVIGSFGAHVVIFVRLRVLFHKTLKAVESHRAGVEEGGDGYSPTTHGPVFSHPREVELSTRFLHKFHTPEDLGVARDAYYIGLQQYPQNAMIMLQYLTFLMDFLPHEMPAITTILKEVRHVKLSWPEMCVLALREKTKSDVGVVYDVGGVEANRRITSAIKLQTSARHHEKKFWEELLKESPDIKKQWSRVGHIDLAEERAFRLFNHLLQQFSTSPRVLRAYGKFLEEDLKDGEKAQEYYRRANYVEEGDRKSGLAAWVLQVPVRNELQDILDSEHDEETGAPGAHPPTNPMPDRLGAGRGGSKYVIPEKRHTSSVHPIDDDEEEEGESFGAGVTRSRASDAPKSTLRAGTLSLPATSSAHDPRRGSSLSGRSMRSEAETMNYAIYHVLRNDISERRIQRLSKVKKITILTMLLVFVWAIVLYAIFAPNLDDQVTFLKRMEDLVHAPTHLCEFPFLAVSIKEAFALPARPRDMTLQQMKTEALLYSGELKKACDGIESFLRDMGSTSATDAWSDDEDVRISANYANTTSQSLLLLYSNHKTLSSTLHLSAAHASAIAGLSTVDVTTHEYRFMIDNVGQSILPAIDSFMGIVLDESFSHYFVYSVVLGTVLPVVGCLLIIAMFFVAVPAWKKLDKEMNMVRRLFLLVPKSSVSSVLKNGWKGQNVRHDSLIDMEEKEESKVQELMLQAGDRMSSNLEARSSMGKLKAGTLILILLACFLFIGMSILSIVEYYSIEHLKKGLRNVERLSHGLESEQWFCALLCRNSSDPEYMAELEIREWIRHGRGLAATAIAGLETNSATHISELRSKLYDSNCDTQGEDKCLSFAQQVTLVGDLASEISGQPKSLLGPDNEELVRIISIMEEIHPQLQDIIDLISTKKSTSLTLLQWYLLFMIIMTLPLVLIVYVTMIRPAENRIEREYRRSSILLLSLPLSTIESIPSINNYVKYGTLDEDEVKAASKVVETKVKFLIEGATHGVVLFTSDGMELINSRGCEMFQYLPQEVLGTDVSMLFTPDSVIDLETHLVSDTRSKKKIRAEFEAECLRKDGSTFSARIGLTSDIVSGTRLYTLYVQDITQEKAHERLLVTERDLSEKLLENILPKPIARRLKAGERLIADTFSNVTILFSDIVQFTNMSSKMKADELVSVLGDIFSRFDHVVTDLGLTKIKTIGDAYMIVSGAPEERYDHAEAMMECALRMLAAMASFREDTGRDIHMRIGMHTGGCIAGVIGVKKFAYDVWSSDVNIASRMESTGIPDRIQVSRRTYEVLHEKYAFEQRDGVMVKGIGEVTTYLVDKGELDKAIERVDSKLLRGFDQNDMLIEHLGDQLKDEKK